MQRCITKDLNVICANLVQEKGFQHQLASKNPSYKFGESSKLHWAIKIDMIYEYNVLSVHFLISFFEAPCSLHLIPKVLLQAVLQSPHQLEYFLFHLLQSLD